jgi:hypothetical protein
MMIATRIAAAGVIVAALVAPASLQTPASAAAVAPASAARQIDLSFDERGNLEPASNPARAALASIAAGSTDVFVLSHGWRNDAASANCRYQQQIDGIAAALPPASRPLFVKVLWPSAMFPVMHDGCGGALRRPYFAEQREAPPSGDLQPWAAAAFPAAARARGFGRDVERLSKLLSGPQNPRSPELREAAAILVQWRDIADGPQMPRARTIDGPGERALASGVDEALAAYEAIQGAPTEKAPWSVVPGFAEVFSFWTMKARAGIVGGNGVHDVLHDLVASLPAAARVHLVGHSFGGKLLSAALVGRPGAEPNTVESLTILQGALSHFAFSTADQIRSLDVPASDGGAYLDVLRRKLASVVAVTFSEQDRENQRWYPLGTMISRDAFERGVPVYAALGARGIDGAPSVPVALRLQESIAARYSRSRPRVFNVDASGVVLGHSDIMQPRVFKMVADVVAVASRARAEESLKK